jgi:hypothetical protein
VTTLWEQFRRGKLTQDEYEKAMRLQLFTVQIGAPDHDAAADPVKPPAKKKRKPGSKDPAVGSVDEGGEPQPEPPDNGVFTANPWYRADDRLSLLRQISNAHSAEDKLSLMKLAGRFNAEMLIPENWIRDKAKLQAVADRHAAEHKAAEHHRLSEARARARANED